ncbi:CBS domain-containing protein [Streptomyces sp. ISL-100]|uniref:CBS domain-containing protein n=1 Tax=Streptomyces sp. ISL-100 TaxID=2819173 RepID=UPI001BE8DFB4|nr:CBS domain-containing protein [Streptomyces sp. ISL-100]MBT2394832.1 CBS domain-containing protein [Streptomyces sp. ISL-100]
MVHLPQLVKVPSPQRETLRVRDVATRPAQCTACGPDDLFEDVLQKLSPSNGMRILIVDGRRLVGIITARDTSRLVQRHALRSNGTG